MKICFNAMIINEKPTGLGIYASNVLKRMIDLNCIDEIICYNKDYLKKYITDFKKIKVIELKYNKKIILSSLLRNYYFNKYVKKHYINKDVVVYSPTQHGVLIKGIKQIITIHDITPLIYPKGRYHQYIYYKFILPKVIKLSNKIITISENTKNDLLRYYNVDSNKIKVIYNGYDSPKCVNKEESKHYILKKYNIKDYILMMGINYEYKNLHTVIKSYNKIKNEIKNKLVIAGNYNVKYGTQLIKLVNELGLNNYVIFLGYIDENDKNALYQASSLFIYPSLYEGFGFPPLESMANHTLVICSNSSCLPEIVNNSCELFNPNNKEEIKNKIKKMMFLNSEEKNYYIEKGLQNLKRFNWKTTVNEIVELFNYLG